MTSLNGRPLESKQDGQNDYATVYTGKKQQEKLPYTFNATSGYLYLGDTLNILSYAVPSFRSNSVQLATLSEDYLAMYPQGYQPLQCTVSASSVLSCTAMSKATRYRPSLTYSQFVAVPREGQAAADIYLYTQNGLDGRPLGASPVTFMLSPAYSG
jgi:hypothetical protein